MLFSDTIKLPNSAFCISKNTKPISTKFIYFLPYIYTSHRGLSLLCSKNYLLFLPELPKIFTHYSYFVPIAPPIIPIVSMILWQYRSDYIQFTWSIIFTDCFNRIIHCSIRVSRSFCRLCGSAQQAFGRAWALPDLPLAMPLLETNVSSVSQVFQLF